MFDHRHLTAAAHLAAVHNTDVVAGFDISLAGTHNVIVGAKHLTVVRREILCGVVVTPAGADRFPPLVCHGDDAPVLVA